MLSFLQTKRITEQYNSYCIDDFQNQIFADIKII